MKTIKLEKSLLFGRLKKDLYEKYGAERARSIFEYADTEYRALIEAEPNAGRECRYVFPVVAIYRAIDHYAPGDVLAVTRAYGSKTSLRMKKMFRVITSLPGIPALLWRNMDKIAARLSQGYDVRDMIVTKHLMNMDISMCPLYEKAKELGTPEAVQMICFMDKEYMNGFREITYKRTKSVAEGDDCCDYRLKDSRKNVGN